MVTVWYKIIVEHNLLTCITYLGLKLTTKPIVIGEVEWCLMINGTENNQFCSVNGTVCVVCLTVFVNYSVKQCSICLGVVAILLLNVMDVFSVCGGALLDRPYMVLQRMCVLCL